MKLYRVELERTQYYMCYVQAEDHNQAMAEAQEFADGISDYEWEADHGVHGIYAIPIEVESKEQIPPGEGSFEVDNLDESPSVEEWFDERQVEDAGGSEGR